MRPLLDPLIEAVDGFARQLRFFSAHAGGGEFDRLVNLDVARAAAEIAGERRYDLFAAGLGINGQQFFGDEQEGGRAVAALRRARVGESFLQRMKAGRASHALDGFDAATFGVESEHEAGEHRAAVDEDGARAAFAEFAAVLRAHQVQVFAQNFEQRLVRRECHLRRLAVQSEFDVSFLFCSFRHRG